MRRTVALGLIAGSLAALSVRLSAEEPKVVVRLEGALTTASAREPGFYPHYHQDHTLKLLAGKAYRVELVAKDFTPSLSVQDVAKQRGPEAGINPNRDDRKTVRLIYAPVKDGDHAITATASGKETGSYALTVTDVTDNEDEVVDFQLNHIYRLEAGERKRVAANLLRRFTAAGPNLTDKDAITAEAVALGFENYPGEREVYESFTKAFAAAGTPVAARTANALEARNAGRVRYLSLPGTTLDVQGVTTDGKAWDLKDQRGQVVLLYFWYAGSGVRDSIKQQYAAYPGRLVVVGLNLDKTKVALDRSMTRAKDPWPTLTSVDRTDGPAKLFADLAVNLGGSMPVLLVDAEGKVASSDANDVNLTKLLEKLLGPPSKKD